MPRTRIGPEKRSPSAVSCKVTLAAVSPCGCDSTAAAVTCSGRPTASIVMGPTSAGFVPKRLIETGIVERFFGREYEPIGFD